jgi:hypothetical protein
LESAKHSRAAKPFREKGQRSSILNFEAAERFRAAPKSFQSNVSIQGGVGWR